MSTPSACWRCVYMVVSATAGNLRLNCTAAYLKRTEGGSRCHRVRPIAPAACDRVRSSIRDTVASWMRPVGCGCGLPLPLERDPVHNALPRPARGERSSIGHGTVWSSGVIGACQGAHALTQAHSHPHARTHGQADAIEASDKKGLGDAATDELPVMGPSSDDYYPCATGGLPPQHQSEQGSVALV